MSVKVTADGTLGLYQETNGVASAALNVNSDVPVTIASPVTVTNTLTMNGTFDGTGAPVLLRDIQELTTPIAGAGTGGADVTHNTALAHVFYHTGIVANFTANLTNFNLTSGYATTITLVLVQGGTAYYPNVLKIAGVGQTINWQGNILPVPTAGRTDIVTFSIINSAGTYLVYGQLSSF